jgi:MarC family membrane protein
MDVSFSSALIVLILVTDPMGNILIFATLLRNVDPAHRTRIIVRECLIAFVVLLLFTFFGQSMLNALGLSDRSLNIAGGLILFLIALRLIFVHPEGPFGIAETGERGEPFIVPLAIPFIAGPSAIATVVLLASRAPHRMAEWTGAIAVAISITMAALLFSDRINRFIGERGLMALERLTGLILTAIAVEMLLRGIEGFVRYMQQTS